MPVLVTSAEMPGNADTKGEPAKVGTIGLNASINGIGMHRNRSGGMRVRSYERPPDWLFEVLLEHIDFGVEQEEALVPTLGFI
jgi:hypothetical protein